MKTNRRKFSAEQKAKILRKQLVEKVPISQVCDEYGIKPTQFYQWQKLLFENATAAFEKGRDSLKDRQCRNLSRKVSHLESRLAGKDEVIAEIMESHVQLKKKAWPRLKGSWVEPDVRDGVVDYVQYWSDKTRIKV